MFLDRARIVVQPDGLSRHAETDTDAETNVREANFLRVEAVHAAVDVAPSCEAHVEQAEQDGAPDAEQQRHGLKRHNLEGSDAAPQDDLEHAALVELERCYDVGAALLAKLACLLDEKRRQVCLGGEKDDCDELD